ncbi:MAG: hypothetical protein LC721_00185 [Actinobacteria bacterium]|nr:hypothetical protein [Actinomycetota bacterium]
MQDLFTFPTVTGLVLLILAAIAGFDCHDRLKQGRYDSAALAFFCAGFCAVIGTAFLTIGLS